MKCTKKDIIEKRISFRPMSETQFRKLFDHFGLPEADFIYRHDFYFRFFEAYGSKFGQKIDSYLEGTGEFESLIEISFEDFDFEEMSNEKVIGYLAPCELGGSVPKGALFKKISESDFGSWYEYFGASISEESNTKMTLPAEIVETWEKVYDNALEVDDIVVVTEKINTTWSSEAGGEFPPDNLKLPYFGRLKNKIKNVFGESYHIGRYGFADCNTKIRKATEIEIEEFNMPRIFKIGGENGFDLRIEAGKVFHRMDDITEYVKELVSFSSRNLGERAEIRNYALVVKDIIFSITGCEAKETKLSEWLEVAKEAELC